MQHIIAYPSLLKDTIGDINSISMQSRDFSIVESTGFPYFSNPSSKIDAFVLSSTLDTSLTSKNSPQPATKPGVDLKTPLTSERIYNESLHLQSNTQNLTAVSGYILYASPIQSTELLALLLAAHQDLSTHHSLADDTKFYQFNHTMWSFEVAVANGTLRYGSILSIIDRFLHLTPSQHGEKITWTRVGCLYSGDIPIADIAMVPLNADQESSYVEVSKTNTPLVLSAPVQIMTISPTGVTNSTEIISPNALDIYRHKMGTAFPKRQASSIEREIIMKVFNTGLYVSVHILRNPDTIAARTTALFFAIVIFLALCKFALGAVGEMVFGSWIADSLKETYQLDSGSYRLGQLSARFIMRVTARDHEGHLIAFDAKTWQALANTILEPLQSAGMGKETYAVEGNIRGPDPVNGTGQMVTLGEWQMNVAPTPAVVHDEL